MKERKGRKVLSLVIILNMILSIISPSITVFADSNIKLTLTSNKSKVDSGRSS